MPTIVGSEMRGFLIEASLTGLLVGDGLPTGITDSLLRVVPVLTDGGIIIAGAPPPALGGSIIG